MIQSKYHDIDELQQLKISNINFCSPNKNLEELQNLLQSTNIQFDAIAIAGTRITKNFSVTQNIELSNYPFEHTPTEYSAGGTPLYVANHLPYKAHSDLSIFYLSTIYKHPKMYVNQINNILNLNNLLKKNYQEQKTVFILGYFDIDLMHYNEHEPANEFLDSFASNFYLPYIIQLS